MIYHLYSCDGKHFDISIDENESIYTVIKELQKHDNVDLNYLLIFQNQKLITPKTKLIKNNDGTITLTYFDTFKYPLYSFPDAEFQFSFDKPIFTFANLIDVMFPANYKEPKNKSRQSQQNPRLDELIPNMRFEYTDPSINEPTFPIFDRVLVNGKFVNVRRVESDNFVNDQNAYISTQPDKYNEDTLTLDDKESIRRLCKMGYDYDFVVEVFCHVGKNEEYAASFLNQVLGE